MHDYKFLRPKLLVTFPRLISKGNELRLSTPPSSWCLRIRWCHPCLEQSPSQPRSDRSFSHSLKICRVQLSRSVPTRKANQANAGTATAAHAPADQIIGPMVCQSDFKTCFALFWLLQLCAQVLSPFGRRTIFARIGACWPYTCDGLAIDLACESQTL